MQARIASGQDKLQIIRKGMKNQQKRFSTLTLMHLSRIIFYVSYNAYLMVSGNIRIIDDSWIDKDI